jgi:predicted DNA-binding protein
MQHDEHGPELEPNETSSLMDDASDMAADGAVNASSDLRKRRSTRIVQAVPLVVTGVDALGRPFAERTSTLIINCHGCRYQSKHYVLKNMWVNLEVPHPEPGHTPRRVRGKVAWIQRPRTVRQLFQVALELEVAGNAWGIGFPPDDWFVFPEESGVLANPASAGDLPPAVGSSLPLETPLPIVEAEPGVAAPDNLRVFPAPASATDASLQLARQVARLLAEAKQQIHAAAREAAVQSVSAERRVSQEQWEQKYAAFREEVARETAHAINNIQAETETRALTAQAAAAESLKNELPRWLAPQLEQLTHELTDHLAREGALQRDQHEKQLGFAHETLQTLCTQAEEAAAKLRTQAEVVESQVAARIEAAARRAEEEARQREESAVAQREALAASAKELQERNAAVLAETQNSLRQQQEQQLGEAQSRWQAFLDSTVQSGRERADGALREEAERLRKQLEGEGVKQSAMVREALEAHIRELEDTLGRASTAAERLEQHAARVETVQQQALNGFHSQLDDVLTLHRNELHRRSENLFEEIHARIRSSFEAANSEALEKFDQQIHSMVQPHITQTEEAVHRLAGGRSLLDAAMTMQQDRIRATADEAFADSLARFRENLGSVEQLLSESSQTITSRHLEDLETKAVDLKHHTVEEIFKSAEWYEKKAQTQLQNLTEKLVEQSGSQLREKAGEVSGLFTNDLQNASRNFIAQTQKELEDSVRDAFERVRILFAEAADTTSAAFTDEIQRNARQELDGFTELMQKSIEVSRERMDAAREETGLKMTADQEAFLQRFQSGMRGAVENGLADAQEKVKASFDAVLDSWSKMSDAKQVELQEGFVKHSDRAAEQYRDRLENISNSWMVATVTTLDHQSRDVIAKIAATAEERLREASAEVFARFGDTLRERLLQIATSFDKPLPPAKP